MLFYASKSAPHLIVFHMPFILFSGPVIKFYVKEVSNDIVVVYLLFPRLGTCPFKSFKIKLVEQLSMFRKKEK